VAAHAVAQYKQLQSAALFSVNQSATRFLVFHGGFFILLAGFSKCLLA